MQTSGLILDIYDDYRGDVIRSLFPTRSSVPGLIKEAQALSVLERDLLPDDAFALVLMNGEEHLRKYACIDAGNTALSVIYFLQNGHKLPEEAQKTAAANLGVACGWYDLPVQGLEKIAILGWAARTAVQHPWTALQAAMVGPEVVHEIKENNKAVSQIRSERGESTGGMPIGIDQMHEHRMMKGAEVSGTDLAPMSSPTGTSVSKSAIKKTGSMGHLIKHPQSEPGEPPQTNESMKHKEQPAGAPQASVLKPHVDVTNKEASSPYQEKKASCYALGSKYPLDSYAQVKTASQYFEEYGKQFSPENRREYCLNLIKRAELLNIPVSEQVRHYGGDELAPPEMLKVAFDLRATLLEDEKQLHMLSSLFEKAADLGPELFCDTLSEFDKIAGLNYLYDKDIPDPYFSVLYKKAEEEFSFVDGNDMITEDDLRRLAKIGTKAIKHTFGEDFMVEFQNDPVGIFKSLPRDQKKMIMHMANDNSAPGIALLA